ncbi:MAG: right-handed parallel beta-helix repeat-containing protein, partial [Chloroflexi bacterium]|nr:right-handed parallel beta-helix repeat-containing protein [Chloroflexota bacterium]
IGGSAPGDRNVISGNFGDGIDVATGANGTVIRGNYIGTNGAGTAPLQNGDDGIEVGAAGTTIGGTAAAERNVISGNFDDGVVLIAGSDNAVIQGNYIGTDAAGAAALGNGDDGINVVQSTSTTIGGTGAGAGNTIAFNAFDGVYVQTGAAGNSILGNSIHSNGGLAIDLGVNGVTANDPAPDADAGANNLQNFPVLLGAATDGGQVTITGTLSSTASRTFRIEFFANTAADPSGYGEASRYLGFASVTTDASGSVAFSVTLPMPVAIGEFISATATDTITRDTSELAQNVAAVAMQSVSGTVLHDVDADADVTEGGTLAFAGATVRLYLDDGDGAIDPGDGFVATTLTDAAGNYSFGSLASGTYYVVVDSKTLAAPGYNLGFTIADIWAEQTYGAAGSASGAGFTVVNGTLYGGKNLFASDNASGLITAEHVTRVIVAGANVTGVDSGFSFSAVVNARGNAIDDDLANPRLQQGTLRQFILNSNAISGVQTSNFSIGSGLRTIAVTGAALPTITDAVILDATTQEGFAGTPLIELDGTGAGLGADGLTITAGASTVRGFVIGRFSRDGISISGAGGNTIAGNYLGTDAAGSAAAGNGQWG